MFNVTVTGYVSFVNKNEKASSSVVSLGISSKRSYKQKEGAPTHDVAVFTAFGAMADNLLKYVQKGSYLVCTGTGRSHYDQENKIVWNQYDLILGNWEFGPSTQNTEQAAPAQNAAPQQQAPNQRQSQRQQAPQQQAPNQRQSQRQQAPQQQAPQNYYGGYNDGFASVPSDEELPFK